MEELNLWEYRVQTVGGRFRSIKDSDLEIILNEWGQEGWEVINVEKLQTSLKTRVVAKRPLTQQTRRQRSYQNY
jgi:hypothetical protein